MLALKKSSVLLAGLLLFILIVLSFSWWQWRLHVDQLAVVALPDQDQLGAGMHPVDQAALAHFGALKASALLRGELGKVPRQLTSSAYRLNKFEITQGQFARFVAWLVLQPQPERFYHPDTPEAWRFASLSLQHRLLGKLEAPANSIGFWDAFAYCRAAGGELPTQTQWLAAASGSENRAYPWGNSFYQLPWRYQDPMLNLVAPADSYPEAASPDGVFNLGSGVSEWVQGDGEQSYVQMGGNAALQPAALHALNYIERPTAADYRSPYVGFRCAFADDSQSTAWRTAWGDSLELVRIAAMSSEIGVGSEAYLPLLLNNLDERYLAELPKLLQPGIGSEPLRAASEGEITRAQYRDFLRDPLTHLGFYANEQEPVSNSYQPANWREQLRDPLLPVVGVDWWDAYAFANWIGGSLPSEQQWLQLASITERAPQPNEVVAGNFCLPAACPLSDPLQLPANSLGLRALHGNVSEWTSTVDLSTSAPLMLIKGGNALLPEAYAGNSAYTTMAPAEFSSPLVGIRVVFGAADS